MPETKVISEACNYQGTIGTIYPNSQGKPMTEMGNQHGVQTLSFPVAIGKHSLWKCFLTFSYKSNHNLNRQEPTLNPEQDQIYILRGPVAHF